MSKDKVEVNRIPYKYQTNDTTCAKVFTCGLDTEIKPGPNGSENK